MSEEGLTGSDFERRIIDMLGKELLSVSQIAKRLGMRRDVAAGYLEALKNQGKLELHKVGRSNVYMISKGRKNE